MFDLLITGAIFEHDSEIAIRSSIFELAVEEANRYLESYNIKLASEIRNSSNVVTSYQKGKLLTSSYIKLCEPYLILVLSYFF